jgi:acetyl esterase/lipase
MTLNNKLSRLGLVLAVLSIATACSPLAVLDTVLASEQGFVATRNVSYGPEPRHRLDVYQPTGSQTTQRPAVVFFYGGSWRSGQRAHYRFVGQALAKRGITTIIPDYRLYPDAAFPAFVTDGARALRWVFDNAEDLGIDTDRLNVAGHSAGAHLAAILAVDPSYLAAQGLRSSDIRSVIGIAGPYAFDPLAYRATRPIFGHLEDIDGARPVALVAKHHLDGTAKGLPQFTLLHGADDDTVTSSNSEALAAELRRAGASASLSIYEGVDHYRILLAFFPAFRTWAPVLDDVADAATSS